MDIGDHDGVRHDMKDMDGHATKPDETAKDPDMKMDGMDHSMSMNGMNDHMDMAHMDHMDHMNHMGNLKQKFWVILMFILGAGAGGIAAQHIGRQLIWASCVLLFVCFALMFIKEDIEHEADFMK